jgi:hypothetical protein
MPGSPLAYCLSPATHDCTTPCAAPGPTPRGAPRTADAEQLGDAIAELAARIHAATYELLVLIRQFDACDGWHDGFHSCAHWLHWRTGIDLGAAREKVRVAHALADLPLVSASMQRGVLSYSKVRALTRVATPTTEARLVDAARCGTTAHVERLVRAWRRVDRLEAAQEAQAQHRRRQLDTWVDDDGMLVLRGRLTPEVGAVVQRALEAAADRLWREGCDTPRPETVTADVTAGQRRADALGLLAEAALAADLDRGTAGDRYQVVIHVDAEALAPTAATGEDRRARACDGGQAALEDPDGRYVSAETSRRLACDAATVVMRHAADGTVLDVGRKTRTIPPAIRRALTARDHRCRFPGCTARRCDAHHVQHWAQGGATRLDNLVLLCRRHHRFVHEAGWTIAHGTDDDGLRFFRPNGTPLEVAPPSPRWADDAPPLTPTLGRLLAHGIAPGQETSTPHWDGARLEVGWAIDVLWSPSATGHLVCAPRRIVCEVPYFA